MAGTETTNLYCKTCNRTMERAQFYQTNRLDKYPNGFLPECKKCLTRHVDNYNPETFTWILKEIDVPYIPKRWSMILDKCVESGRKMTGMTVLGRYLSAMKLNQFNKYHWEDTERLIAEENADKRLAMSEQGYTEEEIDAAIASGTMPDKPPEPEKQEPEKEEPEPIDLSPAEYFDDDLTEEDRKYLTIKWGKAYKPYEWVQLEKYYQEMMNSFDIVTPSHEDYLKLICKTSLKMHQCIDISDIEGFQKLSRVYTSLMKDAKFTAIQNKGDNGEYVSSVSELVLLCEREGFIERYYTDTPKDKPDETLKDLRSYNRRLILEELNLGNLIESSVRAMAREEAKEEDEDTIEFEDENLESLEKEVLTDGDFLDHYDFLEEEQQEDKEMMEDIFAGGDTKYGLARPT